MSGRSWSVKPKMTPSVRVIFQHQDRVVVPLSRWACSPEGRAVSYTHLDVYKRQGPGTLILFRMGAGAPAKHCGILGASVIRPSLIHAYDRSGVVEEAFTPVWSRSAAFAFLFPAPSALSFPPR